jgi:hypothetical protein
MNTNADPIHYEKQLVCKAGTCSFCFKFSNLCADIEIDFWEDENNHPILCQECDDLCWVHERPVKDAPHTSCVCEIKNIVENTNNV